MTWHPNSYAFILFTGALVTTGVAAFAWRRRAQVGVWPALTLLGTAIWCAGYGIATGVHDLTWRIFWAKVQYIGMALAAVTMAGLVIHYAGRERWLRPRNIALLSAVPTVGLVLAWTNELHHLIWAHIELRIVGPLALLDITYGPYFWFYFAYNTLILLTASIVFLVTALRAPHLQRRQAVVLLIGTLCPTIALLLYISGLNPLPNLDLTPLGYSVGNLVVAWGLLRHRLFDLVPVARDKVLENMQDGVFVLDAQGRVLDANPAMLQLFGRSAGEVIGRSASRLLNEQHDLVVRYRDRPEAHDEIAIGTGDAHRYFDLRISPLYGRRRQLTGRMVVLHDVTDRKHAEEERERLIGELDAFAHTVAHDLKSPLTAVIGYAELLKSRDPDLEPVQQEQCLNSIVWMGRKMTNIIDELLLLASIRREDVRLEPLDLGEIVAEALERLAFMREYLHAQIEQPRDWPAVLGHASWVEEVWVNYISNAIRYGGNPPHVALGADVLADGMVRLWIRDNGPGIAAEDQVHLFLPFTQVSQLRARGHGLGLSIVHHIVERLGGQVGVESVVGQGSLFFFTLPLARETPPTK